MARTVSRPGSGVNVVFEPPIEFILRQTGRFRHALEDLGPLWEGFKRIMEGVERERFISLVMKRSMFS